MGIKTLKLLLFKMTILCVKLFMKKNNSLNDTMNELDLQKLHNSLTLSKGF